MSKRASLRPVLDLGSFFALGLGGLIGDRLRLGFVLFVEGLLEGVFGAFGGFLELLDRLTGTAGKLRQLLTAKNDQPEDDQQGDFPTLEVAQEGHWQAVQKHVHRINVTQLGGK